MLVCGGRGLHGLREKQGEKMCVEGQKNEGVVGTSTNQSESGTYESYEDTLGPDGQRKGTLVQADYRGNRAGNRTDAQKRNRTEMHITRERTEPGVGASA